MQLNALVGTFTGPVVHRNHHQQQNNKRIYLP